MKNLILFIFILCTILSCGGRGGNKTIPIKDMEKITTEIFLANAYNDFKSISKEDSLDIYEPIFKKYGYTSTDMLHTIKELTKRKSVRYSDILDAVIKNLETEFKRLDKAIVVQDTIDARILRYYTSEIYFQDSIIVKDIKDTAKLKLLIPLKEGSYSISFNYYIDSLDKNKTTVYRYGVTNKENKYQLLATRYLHKKEYKRENVKLPKLKETDSLLTFYLATYTGKNVLTPSLRFDSISIYYTPAIQFARDSFIREKINIQQLFDRYYEIKEDSCTLCADSSGLEIQVDSLPEL